MRPRRRRHDEGTRRVGDRILDQAAAVLQRHHAGDHGRAVGFEKVTGHREVGLEGDAPREGLHVGEPGGGPEDEGRGGIGGVHESEPSKETRTDFSPGRPSLSRGIDTVASPAAVGVNGRNALPLRRIAGIAGVDRERKLAGSVEAGQRHVQPGSRRSTRPPGRRPARRW